MMCDAKDVVFENEFTRRLLLIRVARTYYNKYARERLYTVFLVLPPAGVSRLLWE